MIESLLNEELEPERGEVVIKAFAARLDILNFELKAATLFANADVRNNHRKVETKLFENPLEIEHD